MKEEMEELYAEGLASRGGPEPCGRTREGRGRSVGQGYVQAGY